MNSGNTGNHGSNGDHRDICSFEKQGYHAKTENKL
jgi:hypothetical protein